MWEKTNFYFLSGDNKTGKTITLKKLYCLFMEHGAIFEEKIMGSASIEYKQVENELNELTFPNSKHMMNFAVRFTYKGKHILLSTWGDAFDKHKYSIVETLKKLKSNDDVYIGACHLGHKNKIGTLLKKEVSFTNKKTIDEPSKYLECDFAHAEVLFELIDKVL